MGEFLTIKTIEGPPTIDTIRIDQNKRLVNLKVAVYQFRDKDTLQIVQYLPAFEISSYGDTEVEATEMLNACVDDILDGLIELSQKHLQAELRKMGWKQIALKNKQYSKAFVDINGELQNLNAVDNKVERLALTT